MSPNRRIFLNAVATYGRSLLALVCGLFSGRWLLACLGEVDYGLYFVIAGLTAFMSVWNGVVAIAVGRFYAVSIGKCNAAEEKGEALEECRRWFNIALLLHTVLPVVLVAIGYPVGAHAVECWLTIPSERVGACIWVWRFVCLSCFVGMLNVPFSAMYTAKQYIAELTIYSIVQTLINVLVLYYMVSTPGDWFVYYALSSCLLSVCPQILICLRALQIFPECHVNLKYCLDLKRFRMFGKYLSWQIVSVSCGLLRLQGISILVNKTFGPAVNAAQAVSNTVNGHSTALATSMIGAFTPAITVAYGANDLGLMRKLALRVDKFALVLMFLFILPLSIELNTVLHLWLRTPPAFTYGLCLLLLAELVFNNATVGQCIVCNARQDISVYMGVSSFFSIFALPTAILLVFCGCGVYAIGAASCFFTFVNSIIRVVFASRQMAVSARKWLSSAVLPLGIVGVLSIVAGRAVGCFMQPSLMRVCLTTFVVEIVFVPLVWFFAFDSDERLYMKVHLYKMLAKIKGENRNGKVK